MRVSDFSIYVHQCNYRAGNQFDVTIEFENEQVEYEYEYGRFNLSGFFRYHWLLTEVCQYWSET